ncbi:hypothetical protein K3495_g16669, partial [Podosphaera aphanis]
MTAKQLFDHVANAREEGATTPWETAVRKFLATKFTTTAENYCNEFLQNFLDVNSAAETMVSRNLEEFEKGGNMFEISLGLASFMFIMGTEGIPWLDTWRQTKTLDKSNRYVSLDTMMSTLRQVANGREGMLGHGQSAIGQDGGRKGRNAKGKGAARNADPESLCQRCTHKHKNKHCFKQHPELRKNSNYNRTAKADVARATEKIGDRSDDSETENEGASLGTVASIAAKHKNRLLYDTGASHHF